MEVVVASTSPLGQYLTPANDGEARPLWLSGPRAIPKKRFIRDQTSKRSRNWRWMRWMEDVRRCVEVKAVQRLIPELCAFHPTIRWALYTAVWACHWQLLTREELQQAGVCDPVVFRAPSKSREGRRCCSFAAIEVLRHVRVNATNEVWRFSVVVCTGAAVLVAVVTAVAGRGDGELVLLQTMKWVVAATTFFLLGMEVCVRLLHAWYARCSRRLVGSLDAFVAGSEKFNEVYAGSLTIVKRAELASRGYRLGTGLLPPIGRLESSTMNTLSHDRSSENAASHSLKNQLRCLPLRRKLRTLNEQLNVLASVVVEKDDQAIAHQCQVYSKEETIGGEQAPSLLLTALSKQHDRGFLLLENVVHSALVRNMTPASLRHRKTGVDWSLLCALDSLRSVVEQVVEALRTYADDLEDWNTSQNPVALLESDPATKFSDRQRHEQVSNANDTCLNGVASPLYELRSASETLAALVVAAQHELLPADSAAERLIGSRDAMHSMVLQLQEAWTKYNSALSALNGREDKIESIGGGAVVGDKIGHASTLVPPIPLSSVPAREDINCTVVFTGTSTGDDGFDLQALLKQQETNAVVTAPGSVPNFIRELRDVLAYRQTQAPPKPTKQVDHDPPALVTSAPEAPSHPPSAAMFAPPYAPLRRRPRRPLPVSRQSDTCSEVTAHAFNLELRALLERSQKSHHGATECLGNSDVDDDAECGIA
uniref:Myosin-binding domain-containing protein n=1 Tax=Hyaloperonospora arabidopsidis (strain Emoy2) TaxID=559515 RepID=M4BY33_HYAAE